MITFPNTHSKHISSSIAKVGRLLYQNKIQTSAHPPLSLLEHDWINYKAYNLHNKYYFSIQISYIANMEILWNICICTKWERYDTRAQSSISQWLLCLMFCTECYWSYSKDKVFCSRKWGGVNVKVSSCMCCWGSSVISLTGHTRWTDNICTFNYEQAS